MQIKRLMHVIVSNRILAVQDLTDSHMGDADC